MMKKTIRIIIVSIMLALGLFACANQNRDLHIEAHDWKLSCIQSNVNGDVLFCSEEMKENYPSAQVTALVCEIENETIVLFNGNELWKLEYEIVEKTPESILYEMEYDETGNIFIGNAVSSITEYEDDTFEYTFLISIGEYTLHFVSNT